MRRSQGGQRPEISLPLPALLVAVLAGFVRRCPGQPMSELPMQPQQPDFDGFQAMPLRHGPIHDRPSLNTSITLMDGRKIPTMGLGVYMSPPGRETEDAVRWALESGYRMVDTAMIYRNEESVGKAIAESGVPRSEVFLTTKLWDDAHGYKEAQRALRESLDRLKTDYLDLYLIHSPTTGKLIETWDALVEMQRAGLIRSVGVANFNVQHLEALVQHGRPLPVVNQVEMHPLNWKEREPLLEWCRLHGVLVQAYGSLFFGKQERLAEDAVQRVAAAKGRTAAQVLLRWGHQMGFQLIPKSVKKERIIENSQIFDFQLDDEEMGLLSSMRGELGAYWQPLGAAVDLGDTTHGEHARLWLQDTPLNGTYPAHAGEL